MKMPSTVLGGLLLTAVSVAHASPVTLKLADHGLMRVYQPQTQFEINPDLGRAWVSVSFDLKPAWDESPAWHERIAVDGLRFDAEKNAVILTLPDREVTCAAVEQRQFLGLSGYRIQPTDACRLETITDRKPVDNGFFISNREVSRTLLHVEG